MKFNERVLLNELKLNDTDDQIIDYIKENKDRVIKQSIQKTAEDLFIVPNSIVRLAKKLGYEGFSQMKYALKEECDHTNLNKEYVNNAIPENIVKTMELIDVDILNKVVQKISESRDIILLGIGDSTCFCDILVKNFRCVGKNTIFFEHRHDMIYSVDNCKSKDLCIAISVSGESKDIIEAAKKAKDRGAYVISITHFAKNTLSDISDNSLYFYAPKESKNNYNTTDRIGLMILIRKISEELWKHF